MPTQFFPPVIARSTGFATVLIGLMAPLGVAVDIRWMQSVFQGDVLKMGNMAAAGLVLAGAALVILGGRASSKLRAMASAMALLVAAIGIITAGQHLFETGLGIDEVLSVGRHDPQHPIEGSMSSYAALAFGAIGLALVALPWAGLKPLVWLMSAFAMVVGMVSLLGYLWGSARDPAQILLTPVSAHAAIAFTLLGIGTWFASNARHPVSVPPAVASRTSIEIRVIIGFALSIVLLLAGSAVTYRASEEAARSARWMADNQAARALLAKLFADVVSAESAARANLLTGSPAHREAFASFVRSAQSNADALEARLADDPAQLDVLGRLNLLKAARFERLDAAMSILQNGGAEALSAFASTQQGTGAMDAIRQLTQRIDDRIGTGLTQMEARNRVNRQKALFTLDLALLFAVGIFLFLLYHIRREMLARAGSDTQVRHLNAALEKRVQSDGVALDANQRRLADMFEYGHDALLMIDRQGRVMQMNRQAEALFGRSRAELVGERVSTVLPVDIGLAHPSLQTASIPGPLPQLAGPPDSKLHALRKDGTEFPVELSLSTLGTQAEFVIMAAVRDVTERERMTAALKDSAALYRQTLDNMLEGCTIVGFDWTYLYVNAAAALQIRQPADQLIGKSVKQAHPGYVSRALATGNRKCMEERVAVHAESDVVFPDGSIGWFQIRHLPAPEGMAVFSVDITERKQAEAENLAIRADLEQRVSARTAELELSRGAAQAANVAKSAFLAAMSHEIRTPMNGVIGMVDVLAHSEMPEEQADAVRTIRASAFALLGIIDDILDFSKIEADRLDLEHAPLVLHELIENVCNTVLPVAVENGVDLDLFIAPEVPSQLWSDSTRLRQVLFNLLGNAIKFSGGRARRRGEVSLQVGLASGDPERMVMRFEDNGIGMAPQTIAELFSPFTQAEASTTRRFGGTGLGLTISKRLVELMGGEIEVESRLGEGSVFVVSLPVERVEGSLPNSQPDLIGLDCIVVGASEHAEHLCIHLVHAGATVHREPDLAEAPKRTSGLLRPVVVHTSLRDKTPEGLLGGFAEGSDARHLVITRGWHGRSLQIAGNMLTLDGNCLSRSVFLRAVAVAAGRESPTLLRESLDIGLSQLPTAGPTVAEARAQGRLILVAEDDAINQKVILRQIELLGYAAEIAHDGAEALRLWKAGPYALLLTDLHMPEMDGYALAKAIRSQESIWDPDWTGAGAGSWIGSGESRMPIVALTANAIRGEAARAREAGMDEYLTKPLQLHLLKVSLQRWIPDVKDDAVASLASDRAGAPTAAPVIDPSVLPSFVGDDPAVLRQFMDDFREATSQLAGDLRLAHSAGDILQIGAIAHKLKSSSRSVGAVGLGDACAELENVCRGGPKKDVADRMAVVEAALLAVRAHLA